ncbi:hypothetical protein [Salinibacter sp.]|uniref:hypothetical protein n=1 Tax=Salinibacter sp. TaxID=2065818 RepID=UPI0021E846B8|nr:hypothetical protein [Salinibacter sp.]
MSHPAHIHNNSVEEGGEIEFYLSAVNGRSPSGQTARKIGLPIEDLASFNGYVNVHQSPANLGVVAQGNIGANAEGTEGPGLDFVDDRRATTYPLEASATDGSVLSDGVSGTVRFEELTGYNGYVNIHQAVADNRRGFVFAQGNIGANAGDGSSSGADVTTTVNNVGNSAWEVTGVSGASGVAGSGDNPSLTFETGKRYRIDNNGMRSAHPFAIETGTDGDYLLNQDGDGSLEGNSGISYEEDAEGITFTYTQTLADQASAYQCTFHTSMEGNVQTDGGGGGGGGGGGEY